MTTEMNPSPVTVTNPAEEPAKPDLSPVGPSTVVAEQSTGSCSTSAPSDAKRTDVQSDSGSCATTQKSGSPDVAASGPPALKPESAPDSGCCGSAEKDGKSATTGSN